MNNSSHPCITRFSILTIIFWIALAGCAGPQAPAPAALTSIQAPDQSSDWPTEGWKTSPPEEQGLDAARLAQMQAAIQQQNLSLHSLLIVRHGYLVSETYYPPYKQDTRHELYSCTKSFIATLIGIAIDKGFIGGIDQPVLGFFPEYSFDDPGGLREAIKLEHLLTMTSGLDWQEGDPVYRQMYLSEDWVSFVLETPMAVQPGTRFNYCSGCSHILSAIIQRATRMPTQTFAEEYLFEPLGISGDDWHTDAAGMPIGGWGLQLTPRDMAKLGYLYLHQGQWDGQQIVPAEWVQAATQKHTATESELGYGYQWWTYPKYGAYAALGRDGQTIFVIPEMDMIVVTTAASGGHEQIFQLIDEYIVPAAH